MKYLFALLFFAFVIPAKGQDANLRKAHFNLGKNGLALEGYDPVSYFRSSGPVKGKSTLALSYFGVTYWFSSQGNLEDFKRSPASYEPAYGGWCAYAMGNSGEKVEVDPETYKVVGGKLYLFYNAYFNNTLPKWNANEKVLMTAADANWKKIFVAPARQ